MTLRLTGIHLYPLKSAAGIDLAEWDVDEFGLRLDRRWMVADLKGGLVSQRTHPRLCQVTPVVGDTTLTLQAPRIEPLTLPFDAEGRPTQVIVWDDVCDGVSLGPGPAQWVSEVLGSPCRIIHMPDSSYRPADPAFADPGVRVSFADGFPFLMVSEESLADLNARMPRALPMNRFRPNLVIAGASPYVEDTLGEFAIGGIGFRRVKPCGRCVVTTTDQVTGERGKDPLRTLATYRRQDGEVMFGQNVVHRGTGRLAVGADLLV